MANYGVAFESIRYCVECLCKGADIVSAPETSLGALYSSPQQEHVRDKESKRERNGYLANPRGKSKCKILLGNVLDVPGANFSNNLENMLPLRERSVFRQRDESSREATPK